MVIRDGPNSTARLTHSIVESLVNRWLSERHCLMMGALYDEAYDFLNEHAPLTEDRLAIVAEKMRRPSANIAKLIVDLGHPMPGPGGISANSL